DEAWHRRGSNEQALVDSEEAGNAHRAKGPYWKPNHRQCCTPIPKLIEGLNRHLEGWKNYFDFGYPRQAFREINAYARDRVTRHLKRRSQRPFRPPEGVSFYRQIQRFGLVRL